MTTKEQTEKLIEKLEIRNVKKNDPWDSWRDKLTLYTRIPVHSKERETSTEKLNLYYNLYYKQHNMRQ